MNGRDRYPTNALKLAKRRCLYRLVVLRQLRAPREVVRREQVILAMYKFMPIMPEPAYRAKAKELHDKFVVPVIGT